MAEIFRQQAVEHHRSGRGVAETAEPGSMGRTWGVLCGLVVLGLVGAAVVSVPRYARGSGVATTDREIVVEVSAVSGAPAVLQQGTARGTVAGQTDGKVVVRLDVGTVEPGSRYQVWVRVGFRSILEAL
ncbi:hypothetical protein ABZ345_20310 [Lentzea sp. NPDC005914]|uniref:hypothetical protein n=1 Tax=Lentzea sp. NPDC005914 TaxID=3154572 RepID=UPI0033E43B46